MTSVHCPSAAELAARARSDLRLGLPVALRAGDAITLAAAAETVGGARLAALTAGGDAALALTAWRARTLAMRVYDGDLARLPLAPDLRPAELAALIAPEADLATPLKGPFAPLRGGDAGPARAGIALAKAARLLPAVILRAARDVPDGLTIIDMDGPPAPATLSPVVAASLPMAAARAGRLHVFRPDDGGEEHYAVEVGTAVATPLVRLHSACFTGDVLGSLKCDCGPQLRTALARMNDAGGGVLLYLNQEGRGIGLANKMRAYALQDQGFDTVEANHRLGFEDDERDFRLGSDMLRSLGVSRVRLLTNNPRKVDMLAEHGIDVAERVPLWVGENPLNADYLGTKARRSGHIR